MTTLVKEVFSKSEAGSIDADGTRSVTRQFYVYDDGAGSPVLLLEDALSAAGLPTEPSGGSSNSTLDAGGVTLSYWGTRSWSKQKGHNDLWVLKYEYTTSPASSNQSSEINEISGGVRAVAKGVYRINYNAPDWDYPTRADIGGVGIDSGGTKTSISSQESTLTITQYRQSPDPSIVEFQDVAGKRNAESFWGAAIGTVLFMGARYSQNTTTGMWSIQYEFSYDSKTFHAEQVAKTDPNGNPLTELVGSGDLAVATASHVYFVQPFALATFATLPQQP